MLLVGQLGSYGLSTPRLYNPTNNHRLHHRTNPGNVGRTPDLANREITNGFGLLSYGCRITTTDVATGLSW